MTPTRDRAAPETTTLVKCNNPGLCERGASRRGVFGPPPDRRSKSSCPTTFDEEQQFPSVAIRSSVHLHLSSPFPRGRTGKILHEGVSIREGSFAVRSAKLPEKNWPHLIARRLRSDAGDPQKFPHPWCGPSGREHHEAEGCFPVSVAAAGHDSRDDRMRQGDRDPELSRGVAAAGARALRQGDVGAVDGRHEPRTGDGGGEKRRDLDFLRRRGHAVRDRRRGVGVGAGRDVDDLLGGRAGDRRERYSHEISDARRTGDVH